MQFVDNQVFYVSLKTGIVYLNILLYNTKFEQLNKIQNSRIFKLDIFLYYWLISHYCDNVQQLLQEQWHAHLHFHGIFYLNLCKESLIITEASFSHLLHLPAFLFCLVKILHQLYYISTYQQSWRKKQKIVSAYNRVFSHAKMDISWFLCIKLKAFESKLIREIKQKLTNNIPS